MSSETWGKFAENLIITFGTVGAIAFAGIILVIEDQAPFRVKDVTAIPGVVFSPHASLAILVLFLAVSSLSGIAASIILAFDAALELGDFTAWSWMGLILGTVSFMTFLLGVQIVVGDVTVAGGAILFLLAIVIIAIFFLSFYLSVRPAIRRSQFPFSLS